jgi:uncharacterized damage-inducible protein DinB
MSWKDEFLPKLKSEFQTTSRVLKSFPEDKSEFQPHEKSQTAKKVAWTLVIGPVAIRQALKNELTTPRNFPPMPEQWNSVIEGFEAESSRAIQTLEEANEEQFQGTVQYRTQTMNKQKYLWFVLSDHIHHRGQLTVYLRMAGGKVPSIYGPSADEP